MSTIEDLQFIRHEIGQVSTLLGKKEHILILINFNIEIGSFPNKANKQ